MTTTTRAVVDAFERAGGATRALVARSTSVGPVGGEVLGLLSLAVHVRIPVPTVRSMIFAYPTFHRGIEDALNELS